MYGSYRARLLADKIGDHFRLQRALQRTKNFPTVMAKATHGLSAPLIITLTSYPPRFAHLGKTLRSLLDQTVVPDRVVLWVSEQDRGELSPDTNALQSHGLEIRECADLKSYKKLIPALREWPSSYFVTADDDVYYPPDWLESLVSVARNKPKMVVGGRVHRARLSESGHMEPYGAWEHATSSRAPSRENERLFPTGVGGILYPPGAFVSEVENESAFTRICPRGDDIWFFWMSRLAGTEQCRARDWFDVTEWPDSADVALWRHNLVEGGNDEQIRAMERSYGLVK